MPHYQAQRDREQASTRRVRGAKTGPPPAIARLGAARKGIGHRFNLSPMALISQS